MYYKYSELYKQNSIDKQLKIEYDTGTITNYELYSESFELTESLCSENNLKFGTCEASVLKFKVANVVEPLKGKWLTVTETLAGNEDEPFQLGKYKVYSDVPSADRNYRDVTAYDGMYDLLNVDITDWYNNLTFPNTLLNIRLSLFVYLDIDSGYVLELPNDDMVVEKSNVESLSGKDLINAICEVNGCFGHFGRDGKFHFIFLNSLNVAKYPGSELYPSTTLYPGGGTIATLPSRCFDGNYRIEDGYLYFKVYGRFIIRDSEGNDEWYKGNYEVRFSYPEGAKLACIQAENGSYMEYIGNTYYSPYFNWIQSNGTRFTIANVDPEIDLAGDGTFSTTGMLYIRESDFEYISGVPVFDDYFLLLDYLADGDLTGCINWNGTNEIEKSQCISGKYEDYTVQGIDCVQIKNEENDIGAVAGNGKNIYVIEDNFLCYGKSATDLQMIADNIYHTIKGISYLPYEAEVLGNPCLEVGNRVVIKTRNKEIESYILKRTLKGIQSLRDTYSADGEEIQSQNVNSVSKSIIQLKKRTNSLRRTVDETVSEIYALDGNGEKVSRIQQNADSISLKVSKGEVSSEISAESGSVAIKGNRLTVESNNFKLSGTGEVEAIGNIKTSGNNATVAKLDSGSLGFEIGSSYIGAMATAEAKSATGLTINTAQKFLCLGIGTNESATGYYYLNNGLNPNGLTWRHYFEGSIYSTKYVIADRLYCDDLNGYIYGAGSTDDDARLKTSGNFSVKGDFVCAGTKNRVVNTQTYGNVLMNAMESTGAYFTDIGSGKIIDGECYVYLEDKFIEVIDNIHEYQVFITNTSKKKTEYVEKYDGYFVVHGEDGATFDWMLTAKQKDYQNIRMEVVSEDKDEAIDYDESIFYEDNIASTQTEEYMAEFADNIDNEAVAYVTNLTEMENEQFLL